MLSYRSAASLTTRGASCQFRLLASVSEFRLPVTLLDVGFVWFTFLKEIRATIFLRFWVKELVLEFQRALILVSLVIFCVASINGWYLD